MSYKENAPHDMLKYWGQVVPMIGDVDQPGSVLQVQLAACTCCYGWKACLQVSRAMIADLEILMTP